MYPFLWKEDAISDLKQVNRDYMEKNNFFASEGTLFIDSKFFVLSLYIYASNYGIHIVLENNALTYKLKFTLRYKIDEKNIIKKFFGLFISRF